MKCVSVFDCESQTEPSENWPVSSFHELLLFAQIFAHSGGSLPPGWSLQTLDRLSLDGVDETSEGVCFTYASIDKRSWETLWLKTIVITKSHASAERDLRSIYQNHPLLSSYAEIDPRGLTCVIFTRSRVTSVGVSSISAAKTHSTVETRQIVTFGDVLALLLHNSSPPSTTTNRDPPSSIMDLNLKTPEPYQNQTGAQLTNYACPPTPVFPDAPNLDYMPPSLPPAPPPNGVIQEEDQLEDDVISIDESNRGLIIDESTHDDVPHSPADSRRSSPGLPSPLGADHDNQNEDVERHFAFHKSQEEREPFPQPGESSRLQQRTHFSSETDHRPYVGAGCCEVVTAPQAVAVEKLPVIAPPATVSTLPKQTKKDKTPVDGVEPKHFFCDTCQKPFVWKKSFDQHMKVHSGVREFNCPECKRAFSLKKQLVRHLKNHHKAQNQFDCHTCGKKFILEADLQTHLESHAPKKTIKCPYKSTSGCDKTFTSKSLLVIHLRVHTGEKPFKCHVCPKAYQQNQHLKEHLYTHSGELPFLCELCSKGFTSQAQLTLHLKMHANDRRFVCHVEGCEKNYVTKALLTKHVKTVHLGERPYLCPYCDKTYPKIYDLKNHIRSHTGERPFKCDVCLKDFAHKVVWRRHMLLHESIDQKNGGGGGRELETKEHPAGDGYIDSRKDCNQEINKEMMRQRVEERTNEQTDAEARFQEIDQENNHYYHTQWRRHDIYDSFRGSEDLDVNRRSEPVDAEVVDAQTRIVSNQFQPHEVAEHDNQDTAIQSLPPRETQSQQQHYHQHPKFRYLRKENAYSPSTLSAYSETNNEVSMQTSISATDPSTQSDTRYSTSPPPPPTCLEPHAQLSSVHASHHPEQNPLSDGPPPHPEPPPLHQSPFALTKLRGVSLSHALPLPAPSHHALSLSAHPAIHAISGYAHPFNYSLCSSFFPTFPAPEESVGSSISVNSSAHSGQTFVAKSTSSSL